MAGTFDASRRRWLGRAGGCLVTAASLRAVTVIAAEADSGLSFAEIYKSQGVLGSELSQKSRSLAGKPVRILGYLAPPLKPDVRFLVLTRAPVALCPFCNSDADWPSDIVVVYPRERGDWRQDGLPVAVSGTLELGSSTDRETGFVSMIRIVDATVLTVR